MCFAVIEVRYRHETEPDALIPFKDEEAMTKRIDQLKSLETVERVTVFRPSTTHKRVSSWDTIEQSHAKDQA